MKNSKFEIRNSKEFPGQGARFGIFNPSHPESRDQQFPSFEFRISNFYEETHP